MNLATAVHWDARKNVPWYTEWYSVSMHQSASRQQNGTRQCTAVPEYQAVEGSVPWVHLSTKLYPGYTGGSCWLSLEGRLLCFGTVTKMERGYCYCTGTGEKEKLGKEVYLAGIGVTLESP